MIELFQQYGLAYLFSDGAGLSGVAMTLWLFIISVVLGFCLSIPLALARLSGQQEVVIGSPVANRTRSEVEGLIGLFVNTLAVRVDTAGELTTEALLARVKAQALQAQAHQDLPFEQVVEVTRPPRSLAHR